MGRHLHFNAQLKFVAAMVATLFLKIGGAAAADWVALHEADKKDVFFSVNGYPISSATAKIGTSIRANREVNVRANPADWKGGVKSIIPKDRRVTILEIATLPVTGHPPQIWARISQSNNSNPRSSGQAEEQEQSSPNTIINVQKEIAAINATPGFGPQKTVEACNLLRQKLDKPQLRSHKSSIGHYTDIFTPPQTKAECTNVIDTGVPDPGSCTTVVDDCGEKIEYSVGPIKGWTCKATTSTKCTNIKGCGGYRAYKKTMECDVTFQLKLPDFIEKPISTFVDNSMRVIEQTQTQLINTLPIECASDEMRAEAKSSRPEALAQALADVVKRHVEERIKKEAEAWLRETAITTIASAIPSGGLGGAAALGTSVGKFVYRVQKAVKPIMSVANDVKSFAEDVGFGTSCGWADEWTEIKPRDLGLP